MKTTIAQIVNSDKALSNLLEQKLPLGVAIQLGKASKELEPIYQRANEVRMEILTRHGTADPDKPGFFNIPPAKQEAYLKEIKEVFEEEIELTIPTIPISKLPEACLAAKDVIALAWLLEDDTDNNIKGV